MFREYILLAGCLAMLLLPGSGAASAAAGTAPAPEAGPVSGPAAGKFLVATRDLGDWHFSKTVIYLLKHDDEGTLGLIVNRPGKLPLSTVVEGVDGDSTLTHRLHYGGPVETTLVIMLIQDARQSPMIEPVADNVSFSFYREVMERLLEENKSPDMLRFYRGHAGWLPGQLDDELRRGDWHLVDGDPREIFSSGSGRLWQRLIRKLEPEGLMAGSDIPLPVPEHATAGRL